MLKGSLNSDKSVTINIPYKAFDLKFTTTGTKPSTFNYFPIRQAHTANQYTLGRTFLQEAYLIVDYERKNFTIAQALQASDAEPDLVPILSLTADSADPSQPTPSGAIFQTPAGFPTGAIAGIVVAAVVIIAAILGFFCWRRKKRSRGAHTPIPQPVVESPYPPHPIPPYSELANHKSPNGQDYFALQPNAYHGGHTKGAPCLAVSETSELYSPPLGAHGFNPQEQVIPERSELPASDSGPAAELHSEPHSRNPSNVSTPSAFPVGGRFSNGGSPPDMTHGGRAGASPEPWASGTHYDPSSPHPSLMSAQSIPIQYHPGSSANLVSHSAGARDIRRGGSTRSGTSTLVEEPHSDVGPSTGSPEISHSAFQSPYIGAHAQRNNQERYRDVITPEPLDENQATTYFDSTRR